MGQGCCSLRFRPQWQRSVMSTQERGTKDKGLPLTLVLDSANRFQRNVSIGLKYERKIHLRSKEGNPK